MAFHCERELHNLREQRRKALRAQTEARSAEKNSFETASPFPRVWITTPPKEMSLIFMIDCGHEELKIGEKNASTAMLSFS